MIGAPLLAVACVLVALAIFVWRANWTEPANRWFALFTLSVAGWTIGVGGLQSSNHVDVWGRLAFASANLIPATAYGFIYTYPSCAPWPPRYILRALLAIAGTLAAISISTPLIVAEIIVTDAQVWRRPGPLYPVFAVHFLATWVLTLSVFARKWTIARGRDRAQFQYVGAAIALSGTGAITANLLIPLFTGRSTYSAIGPYFGLVLIALIAHAIIRHRLMDLRVVVHRGLTVAIAMVLSTSPVAILLIVFWQRLSLHFASDELVLFLLSTIAVTLLAPPTRDFAQRLLDRYVYRTRSNYQRTVREASRLLTRVLNLKALLSFLADTVVTSTNVEGVTIYLNQDRHFVKASERIRHRNRYEAPDRLPQELFGDTTASHEAMLTDDLYGHGPSRGGSTAHTFCALALPIMSDDRIIGVIALGPKLSGDSFYPDDLDLLMTLANQAGVAIKNARLYEQVVLANEYIENILSTIESGVVAVNAAMRIVMFNRAAERLTGLTADVMKGQLADSLPGCLEAALAATLQSGSPRIEPEIILPTLRKRSGEAVTLPAICTTSPLRDPDGTVLGAVAVFSDLTPLKELEIERRRAERLAYFEVLASGLAHEIKNPLVAIKTFTQLLPRRRNDDRFIDDFGRIATREMERMERLLERLRTLSRPGDRPRHPLDVRAPIREALESLQPACDEKNVTIVVSLGSTPCIVRGDHGELEQLFLNILMNAHEATPPGGALMIDLLRTDEHVAITVGDTGPGVPADLLERVFDPFFTTKQRGSGLGLTICAGIAQTHGARLRAGNRPAGGASFSVEFALVPVPAPVPR
jgi:PAS domain S-box-containing protein